MYIRTIVVNELIFVLFSKSAIEKYPMEIKKEDFAMVRIIGANLETVKGIMGS
ncbi:MAG: hypothetical protein PUG52_01320 [Absicoccus porci]|uniref:hypothetical protein n=1 Tax=Absicoccus porci TaxID=2486576 RepID=UPI002355D51D|nr:hypothetical protein [Absicoccus porci]MCI6088182.1 hypothetical protein [Absicoccus porci]MDD7329665.1 hypothetical protein [Absicoccus porci]MDY4739360.1 hypothetical protein [Absicoccus porci]